MFEDILGKNDDIITIECDGGCGNTTEYDMSTIRKKLADIQVTVGWTCPECHNKRLQDVGVDDV
jgi:hypothetical protein